MTKKTKAFGIAQLTMAQLIRSHSQESRTCMSLKVVTKLFVTREERIKLRDRVRDHDTLV